MRLIDLSLPLQNSAEAPDILHYTDHQTSAIERGRSLGFDPQLLPEPGVHTASERYNTATHMGATHVDAPWHYGPTSEGRPARTIDELPLEWFFSDAVRLDLAAGPSSEEISADEVQAELERTGCRLKPLNIVLVRTGADGFWGTPEYTTSGRVMSVRAAEYILDQGVRVVGFDSTSPDRFVRQAVPALAAGRPEEFLPVHMLGRRREFCIVEKLTNLDRLPAQGFQVCLFPLNVHRGSGGWCRAVAILPG
jgi:kynurenine formamidase